jgi:hypothetical protein
VIKIAVIIGSTRRNARAHFIQRLKERIGALFSSQPTKIDLHREPQSATRATEEVATEAKLLAKAEG